MAKRSLIARFFLAIWDLFNVIRRAVFGVLALVILLLVVAGMLAEDVPVVPSGAALVLMPEGDIVEQYSGDPLDVALARMFEREIPETRQRDLLTAVRRATADDRIAALVLVTTEMLGVELSKLQELRAAVDAFRETGRPVIAYGDGFLQHHYYFASLADTVYMHPQGLVLLQGYGMYPVYFKEGMDKLELEVHVFRVGDYKSAVEPYLRNTMSDEAKEANMDWLTDLWNAYRDDVARARNISPESVDDYVWRYAEHLRAVDGDAAEAAKAAGLVDEIADRDEVREALVELVGRDGNGSFRQVGFEAYLQVTDAERLLRRSSNRVGVVVARGLIQEGDQPQGVVGAISTARLIRRAREANDIKALVLRVDSPGGSIFASDVIRREVELTRLANKPVVVSMSSLATSGGYWISMNADQILANATTLTGSIGIFGLFPSYSKTLNKIGINVDGVGTSPLAGALRPDRPLQPEMGQTIQALVEHGYEEFITKVADARGLSRERVDEMARGRVWSGKDALELGLVDEIGGYHDAIANAARLAGLNEDYSVRVMERQLTFTERLLLEWSTTTLGWVGIDLPARLDLPLQGLVGTLPVLQRIQGDVQRLIQAAQPYGLYSYCFCAATSH